MNVIIRVTHPVFRKNSKIIYPRPITSQCSFCSESQNGKGKNKKHDENKNKKKKSKNIFDQLKDSNNYRNYQSKNEEAYKALNEIWSKKVSADDSLNVKEQGGGTDADHTKLNDLIKSVDAKHYKGKIELPKPSKKVVKPGSTQGLLSVIKELAVTLDGDDKAIQEDLLTAYKSVKGRPPELYKPRNEHKFSGKMKKSVMFEGGKELSLDRLDSSGKLDIFERNAEYQTPRLNLWHQLEAMTLASATVPPPKNYFDQLILWTHQGKLWHFPIDNEQGMDSEKKVDFTKHIFLEEHLEPWCPKSGPLRHFMELVTVGLSKNPYYSVEQKKEHILWFRDYFESKRKVLTEVGALDS